MLDRDAAAKAVPVHKDTWVHAFPHLEALIGRLGKPHQSLVRTGFYSHPRLITGGQQKLGTGQALFGG